MMCKGQIPKAGQEDEVLISIRYAFPFPKTSRGKLIKEADVDNLAKFTLDALSGLFYDDDGQVVGLSCHKAYAENGKTEVHMIIHR